MLFPRLPQFISYFDLLKCIHLKNKLTHINSADVTLADCDFCILLRWITPHLKLVYVLALCGFEESWFRSKGTSEGSWWNQTTGGEATVGSEWGGCNKRRGGTGNTSICH